MFAWQYAGLHLSDQANLGALIADYAGLDGIEAATVEAGGASGAAALRLAYLAVASGLGRCALVVGVEKITDVVGPRRRSRPDAQRRQRLSKPCRA